MEINATIFVTTISFIVFIFVMNSILYKPILEIMEKRQKYIDTNKNEAEAHRNKAQALIDEKNERTADAQRKSRDIVASKSDTIKAEMSQVITDTKKSLAVYFDEQKKALQKQKKEAVKTMKPEVADLANCLTTKILGFGVPFEPLSENELDKTIREVMKENELDKTIREVMKENV